MLITLIILQLGVTESSNINCASSSCSSCTSGYLYKSLSCLPLCPSGYTSSSNSCAPSANLNLFFLNFYEFLDYGATFIDNFSHPSNLPFKENGKASPIPTKDRGFYFTTTSALVSSLNTIMAPDFNLRFIIKITSNGNIFQVTDGTNNYFKLSSSTGSFTGA